MSTPYLVPEENRTSLERIRAQTITKGGAQAPARVEAVDVGQRSASAPGRQHGTACQPLFIRSRIQPWPRDPWPGLIHRAPLTGTGCLLSGRFTACTVRRCCQLI